MHEVIQKIRSEGRAGAVAEGMGEQRERAVEAEPIVGYHDQRWPISVSQAISGAFALSFAVLCGCSGPRLIENTPAAVTVRYDPIVDSFEDATAAATKACAAYGKIARLRQNAETRKTIIDRSAHFECVSE